MIFVGDVALPYFEKHLNYQIPDFILSEKLIGNFEGAVIEDISKKDNILYNDKRWLAFYKHFYLFSLANNHIFDEGRIQYTLDFFKENNLSHIGLVKKGIPLTFEDDLFVFLNFGWANIGVKGEVDGFTLNQLEYQNVIDQVKDSLKKGKRIIVLFHWCYEFELYPQPLHRELAHELVDLGVSLIVGHHSHRVQGIEIYRNVPIVYGLGNFYLPQNTFFNGNLKHPSFADLSLAFEFDQNSSNHKLHWFNYNREDFSIKYLSSELLKSSNKIKDLSGFSNMSSDAYKVWFKKNRIQKKLLPIFYKEDTLTSLYLKNTWVRIRHSMIMLLVKINLKK